MFFWEWKRDDIEHIFESDEDFSKDIADIREINPDIQRGKGAPQGRREMLFRTECDPDLPDWRTW